MKKVHFTLQGKGGVGKSFVSSLLAQFYQEKGVPAVCLDTDPVNKTLAGYKSLDVRKVELMEGSELVQRKFDPMMEQILTEDMNFIIDNGASSFVSLANYMSANGVIPMIQAAGKDVVVHTVMCGGQAFSDTMDGLVYLLEGKEKFEAADGQVEYRQVAEPVVGDGVEMFVWLNEYFGAVEADGKTFEQFRLYERNKDRVTGILRIPRQTSSTFGKDVEEMLERKLTFDDVAKGDAFGLMPKQRLAMLRRSLFTQMQQVI